MKIEQIEKVALSDIYIYIYIYSSSGKLLNNTGIPAWCSVRILRDGIWGGEGGMADKIMTDSHGCMAEKNTKL